MAALFALLLCGMNLSVYAEKTSVLPGDLNRDNKVNQQDSDLFARYFAGWPISEEEISLTAGDMNNDHRVTRADAMILARQNADWDNGDPSPDKPFSEFSIRFIAEDTGEILSISDVFPSSASTDKYSNDRYLALYRTILENDYPLDDAELAAGSIGNSDQFQVVHDREISFSDALIQKEELYYLSIESPDYTADGNYWLPEYIEFRHSDFRKDSHGNVSLDIPLNSADKNLYIRFIDGDTEEVLNISELYYYLQPSAYLSVRYEDSSCRGHISNGFFGGAYQYNNQIIKMLDDQNMVIENAPVLTAGNYSFDLYNTAVSPDTLYWIPQENYVVPQTDLSVDQSGNGHIDIRLYRYGREFELAANFIYYNASGNPVPLQNAAIWIGNTNPSVRRDYYAVVRNGNLVVKGYWMNNKLVPCSTLPVGAYWISIEAEEPDGFRCSETFGFILDNTTDLGTIVLRHSET